VPASPATHGTAATLDEAMAKFRAAWEAKRMTARSLERRGAVTLVCMAVLIVIALLMWPALAEPLPQPKPAGPGGSCPFGYTSSGSYCVPSQGAQDAVPLPPDGTCPFGWLRSGSSCLRSGSRHFKSDETQATASEQRARHWPEHKRQREQEEQRRRDEVIAEFGADLNAIAAELLRYRHAVAQLADAIGWVRTGAPFFAIRPREPEEERTTGND
jgi:hypothetical protein